jgi:FkbM family methyltransferase
MRGLALGGATLRCAAGEQKVINQTMKRLIRSGLHALGFEIRRTRPSQVPKPGSPLRPIGDLKSFLEDTRARDFVPRGLLDVGANRGDWTRLARSIFPDCSVVMIEPQDEMAERLNALCRENSSCHYVKTAVARSEGTLVQTIWEDLYGSSFLPKTDAALLVTGKQRLTAVTTIDKIIAQYSSFHPDLVKLDIQGFEIEALRGGTKLFGLTEVFIIETSLFSFMDGQPIMREVIQFMAEHEYEIYDMFEFGRRPYDGALGQVDLAFVKRNGSLRVNNRWK